MVDEVPSLGSLYRAAFDYGLRYFSLSKYSAASLILQSDSAQAVSVCTAYVSDVVAAHKVVLVVRDAQYIDLASLQRILDLAATTGSPHLIFEYTTESGVFEPAHHKALLAAAEKRGSISILDIAKLDSGHVEWLIRSNVDARFVLTTDAYISWDGNLRSVVELKVLVTTGQIAANPRAIGHVIDNLSQSIQQHITTLTPVERLVLATLYAHVEPIESSIVVRTANDIDPTVQPTVVLAALERLMLTHGFVSRAGRLNRFGDETIAGAIGDMAAMRGLIALAEASLCRFYQLAIATKEFSATGLPVAAVR